MDMTGANIVWRPVFGLGIGPTNNQAEHQALKLGLEQAKKMALGKSTPRLRTAQ